MISTRDRRIILPDSLCPSCAHSHFACKCSLLDDEPFVPGTVKPEADYIEMQRLGKKLGLPCPQAFLTLESLGPDGGVVAKYDDRSRTLNRNYWNWLFKNFAVFYTSTTVALSSDATFGAGHLGNKTTAGVATNVNSSWLSPPDAVYASAGTTTNGIVVGTGVGAESFEDTALGALVASGNSAAQLAYSASNPVDPTYNAGTKTWTATISRILNNNSGGTIVVTETAIYANQTNGSGKYMIMRDKLGASVSVLNAGQLTVTYTFTLTFPA